MKLKFAEKLIYPLIIFVLFFAPEVRSQDGFIEVQAMVDTSTITIGDRIKYSIIINRDKNLQVEKPGEGLNLGQFEIKDYNFPPPEEKNGNISERFDFTISVYDTGKFTIPPFPLIYFTDTTGSYNIIEASPIKIFVRSVLQGDDAPELKDIKTPREIPFDYTMLLAIGLTVLFLAIVAYLGYRAWKKKQEKGYLFKEPEKPLPAHIIALKDLDELYKSDLLENKEYKLFFSRLSEILRLYLENRYFISALEETTSEIMRDLEKHLEKSMRNEVFEILSESDLVKFAKHIPDSEKIEVLKTSTLDFVNKTKIDYSQVETENSENQLSDKTDQPVAELEQK